ncbi:hypothetical protein ACIRPH_30900 [Nocardiopsis sp. NPDC101807]
MEHPLLRGRVGMDRLRAKAALKLLGATRKARENTVNLHPVASRRLV